MSVAGFFAKLALNVNGDFKNMDEDSEPTSERFVRRRRMEIFAFLFLTAVLMPALAVATVGSWGLTVWIYQIINGPPGPPSS